MTHSRSSSPEASRPRAPRGAVAGPWPLILLAACLAATPAAALLPAAAALAASDSDDAGEAAADDAATDDAAAAEEREGEAGATQGAVSPGARRSARKSGKKPEPRIFTNADLKRYRSLAHESAGRGRPLVVETAGGEAASGAPPGALDPAVKAAGIEALRSDIAQGEERLAAIEKREMSLHNPFLPRPALTDEERAASAGKDAKEQIAMLQAEKADIEARLEAQRKALEELRKAPVRPAPAGEASGSGNPAPPTPEPPAS